MPATPSLRALKPARICIVDDTVIHVALLRAILEPRGHTVIPMTVPEDALEEVIRKPPDILMVDIGMPGMDGFSLVEELRSRGMTNATRIVFITSSSKPSDRQRAMDLGASDYILKPFETAETVRRVEALLNSPMATEQRSGVLTPLNNELLSILESAWRLSLPEEVVSTHHAEELTVEDALNSATARVSARARDRGIDVHVHPVPSAVVRGNRELLIRAWTQVLEAALTRAEPGSAVSVSIETGTRGLTMRLGMVCTSASAARLAQLAGHGPSPVRIERRAEAGIDIVVEIHQGN